MPFTLIQAGSTLRTVNPDGGLSAALTLPNGVDLMVNRQPRFAKFRNYIVVVNTPTRPLSVDADGVVRLLTPAPPSVPVALSSGASGTLSGTYLALQTYQLLDSFGNIIAESDYGPAMATAVTIASKKLHAHFPLSGDDVDATQLYRTATNGATYFTWTNVPGNTTTDIENQIADASLGLVEAGARGTAPDLYLIAEFNGRLFGVARNNPDSVVYTEAGTMYGWSALNTLLIPRAGSDSAGITALIPRRAAIGVARRNVFTQVTGSTRSNFAPVVVNGGESVGCVSQESVLVLENDVAYFLWYDGIYKWDSNGISCVTDERVRSWFTTDIYFNRSMFWRAQAGYDPIGKKYRLLMAGVGSDRLDQWIEVDLNTGACFGPHSTNAFSPTCFVNVAGRNQQPFLMMGSREGYLSQDQEPRNDWDLHPIDFHVTVRGDEQGEPEQEKYYGELSVHVKAQDAGTLTITPELGSVDETTPTAEMEADMTIARTRVGRIGNGNTMVMDFTNDEINVDTAIYGYEVDPVNAVGRR
jgi:hypothetical protein